MPTSVFTGSSSRSGILIAAIGPIVLVGAAIYIGWRQFHLPDLVVSGHGDKDCPGTAWIEVKNIGNATSGEFTVCTDMNGWTYRSYKLAPGARLNRIHLSSDLYGNEAAIVDCKKEVEESNEDNNTKIVGPPPI